MNSEAMAKIIGNLSELSSTLIEAVVPGEAKKHFMSARKEALLGIKSLIELEIDRCESRASAAEHPGKCCKSIEITD